MEFRIAAGTIRSVTSTPASTENTIGLQTNLRSIRVIFFINFLVS